MQIEWLMPLLKQYWWAVLIGLIILYFLLKRGGRRESAPYFVYPRPVTTDRRPRTRGKSRIEVSWDTEIDKWLIVAGVLIIFGLGFLNYTFPVHGHMILVGWNDKNGDGAIQSNELFEQSLDMNPYSMVPQALMKSDGTVFIAVGGDIRFKTTKQVNEPFYGLIGVLGYKDGQWTWLTPSDITLNGVTAKKLSDGKTERLDHAYFIRGLRFTKSDVGGPYTSTAVFPYSGYVDGKAYKHILPLSKGEFKNLNKGGTSVSDDTSLEKWMQDKGMWAGDYKLYFYYAFAPESQLNDREIDSDNELLALPVQSPVSFYVHYDPNASPNAQSIVITQFNVHYYTEMAVPLQAAGFKGIVFLNPYLIAAILMIFAGLVLWSKEGKRRRRRRR